MHKEAGQRASESPKHQNLTTKLPATITQYALLGVGAFRPKHEKHTVLKMHILISSSLHKTREMLMNSCHMKDLATPSCQKLKADPTNISAECQATYSLAISFADVV